jgi:threonine dehydrogenase-like Zn-dependent dehydrogenase
VRATVIHAARDVRLEDVPDPVVRLPTDAVVRVAATCVCGSDLWPYRGVARINRPPARIGHEFVGVVEDSGEQVRTVRAGDFVVAPFFVCDGVCAHCRNGVHSSCVRHAWWGAEDAAGRIDGAQGELVRVPFADGTLVVVPGRPDEALIPSLLALSDVMSTGHHAALAAGAGPETTVAVVGDGAVGLCGVLAARRLGAERIVAMSRHPERQRLAREFGATDVVPERGADGVAKVVDLLGGVGADAVLEAVGTRQSMDQAIGAARPGGRVGYVGVPAGGAELPIRRLFDANVSVGGGLAPARAYIEELLADVLAGRLDPGRVFDAELPLAQVADAYTAMDERRAVKVLLRP